MPLRLTIVFLFALSSFTARADPLAPFERLMGGKWVIVENAYQSFHWGPGKHSVQARGYHVQDGEPTLVSTGFWYWDPDEQAIIGVHSAASMQVSLFKYRTRFEGETMVNELKSFGEMGAGSYMEFWEFTGDDSYKWRLVDKATDTPAMEGVFNRLPD